MRALLDTNILIHREAPVVVHQNIGLLFKWLDRLGYKKCIHPVSVEEINRHGDDRVRRSFNAKIKSYHVLKAPAPMAPDVQTMSDALDTNENDRNDSSIVNQLFTECVDLLITEDRPLFQKGKNLGVSDRIFTIDEFLEKAVAENPDLIDYKVLSVSRSLFGNISLADPFFDNFKEEYPNFDRWFHRKTDEPVYVCFEGESLAAFLYLKIEDHREPYPDINPTFSPKRRLKIGTFKVKINGFKLGERFLKIVFDNAVKQRVDEIYVTIFERSAEHERLIKLLEDFGFTLWGVKRNPHGNESVYIRDMSPGYSSENPMITFPLVSKSTRAFLVPIYPKYHTELLPDSILNTESPSDFIEHEPHRNAIRKVYISRSYYRELHTGDVIVFYRTGGYYKSVVTTLGIVQQKYTKILNEDHFIRLCRKRSVFSDDDLREHWRYNVNSRPFIVDFLYCYSFPKRPNMAALIKEGVIRDVESAPRGFERITHEQFETILKLSETDIRFIVD